MVTYPIFLWCKGNTRWLHIIMVFYFRLLGGQEQFILLFYDWISIISMTKDSNKRYQTRTIFEPFFFFVKKCIHCVVSSVKKNKISVSLYSFKWVTAQEDAWYGNKLIHVRDVSYLFYYLYSLQILQTSLGRWGEWGEFPISCISWFEARVLN